MSVNNVHMNFSQFVSNEKEEISNNGGAHSIQLRKGHDCVYLCGGHTVDFDAVDLASIDRAQSWTAT